jgi:hypothetical protein
LGIATPLTVLTASFSLTVANVSPPSDRRSGAGVIRLTTTRIAEQTTNIRMA